MRYSKEDPEKYLIRTAFDEKHFKNLDGKMFLPLTFKNQ